MGRRSNSGEIIGEIRNLRISFPLYEGEKWALRGLDLTLKKGEVFAFVGESGSGKSVTGYTFMGLLPPSAKVEGTILFQGEDLLSLSPRDWCRVRGRKISMIFQEPMTALNPTMKVGKQVAEVFILHGGMDKKEAMAETIRLLGEMGIPNPEVRVHDYPHQLSGGMRQRVLIAMAMAAGPQLLIADEPTTALDVTVQAQIISLLKRLQKEKGTTIFFITHDLGVVAEIAHRVGVIKDGVLLEEATVDDLYARPLHPYTQALLEVLPHWDRDSRTFNLPKLRQEPLGDGCPFFPYCSHAKELCREELPPMKGTSSGRIRCWLY